MIRSLSTGIKGKIVGLEPVAMIIFLAEITSEEPSSFVTFTVLAESNEPKPWKVVILFFFIKYEIPAFKFETTPALRLIIWPKFTFGFAMSIPCSWKL